MYPVSVSIMAEINSDNIVLDNVWLWRADHCFDGHNRLWTTCPSRSVDTAIVVNGNHVTAYGLAAEHTQKDILVWNGEGGSTYFFQAEMDSFATKPGDRTHNYASKTCGYRVNAERHLAVGVGVYSYFLEPRVKVPAGIVVRHNKTLAGFVCPFKWDLNKKWWGRLDSGIEVSIAAVPEPLDG